MLKVLIKPNDNKNNTIGPLKMNTEIWFKKMKK